MLATFQTVRVHRQAHGATGLTPFKAGLDKNLVQTFLLGLRLDQTGARHHQRLFHGSGNLAAFGNGGRRAQVFDARVGAGADKHAVQLDIGDRLIGCQAHVLEGTRDGATLDGIGLRLWVRHVLVNRQHHLWRRTPADLRLDIFGAQLDDGIKVRFGVRHQVLPRRHGTLPISTLRCKRAAFDVIDGLLVNRDHANPRARLDGHVAQGHTAFDRQLANRAASKFHCMAVTTSGANLADHRQHNVLGRDTERQLPFNAHLHVFHFLGDQTLGSQYVLNLGCTDAVRQCTKGAMGRGVRITADNRHTRQGRALLRADNVHDALTHVVHLEFENAEVIAVLIQRSDLNARHFIGDSVQATLALGLGGRHVVIGRGNVGVNAPRLAASQSQPFKRLR